MKIALVYPLNARIPGGGGSYAIHLKAGMEKLGHQIDIFALGSCKNIPLHLIKGYLKNSRGRNNFEILKEYDVVHLTTMSEMGSKKDVLAGKESKLHDLHKYVEYFVTIHDVKNDFKRRLDYEFIISKAKAIIVTSNSNKQVIEQRFNKPVFSSSIPFLDDLAYVNNPNLEKRNKIICLSRFYPGKKTDEFFKMARLLPKYKFVFRGEVLDKNDKIIGGLGAQFYYQKIQDIIKGLKNVEITNDKVPLWEVAKDSMFSVDMSLQNDKDRPQYTTLEAFALGVIPIINPSFSGRMRDGMEVITAETAEEASGKIAMVADKQRMLDYGKQYLKEYTKRMFERFDEIYRGKRERTV